MKIEGEFIFNGTREQVWELVRDPEVLATALPGTQKLELVGENEYEGTMNVRIGPVAGVFTGRISVANEVLPESFTMNVEGRGKPGFVEGTGDIHLIAQEDGTTLMQYDGDVQIGGRLAGVGQRLIDTVSKSMIRQGLEALNSALIARVSAQTTDQEVAYTPPSETEFAKAVAKDMVGEAIRSPNIVRIALIVIFILAILFVILMITRG